MSEITRYNPVPTTTTTGDELDSVNSSKNVDNNKVPSPPPPPRGRGGGSRRSSFGVSCGYGFLILSVALTIFAALTPIPEGVVDSSSSISSWVNFNAYRSHFISYLYPTNSTTTAEAFRSNSSITITQSSEPLDTNSTSGSSSPTSIIIPPSTNDDSSLGSNSTTTASPPLSTNDIIEEQSKNGDQDKRKWMESLVKCNLYEGEWIRDESYPMYPPASCWLVDRQFQCFRNGRPDRDFLKYRWKPTGCTLPRLNATHLLEILRGKRLVFVGDSLNRNMWESLVCVLRNSVNETRNVFEGRAMVGGRLRTIVFKDYGLTVDFMVAPFLVRQWNGKDEDGKKRETLRIDQIVGGAEKFKDADILIFNTGHWWVHEKTSQGKGYYQEGDHVYTQMNATEAFKKSITTWGKWVDRNVNSSRTQVYFRGYSNAHFSGGKWNSGGRCDNETEPMTSHNHNITYPWHRELLPPLLKAMKTEVTYLDITMLTDYRKDAHPSMYRTTGKRKSFDHQDCSHWCLPGVPDLWNELLYTEMLIKLYKQQQQ